jgi:hypothetical protein
VQGLADYIHALTSFTTGTVDAGNSFWLQNALHRRANRLVTGHTNAWVPLDLHNREVRDGAKASSGVFFNPSLELPQLIIGKAKGIALMNSLIQDPILSKSDNLVILIVHQIANEVSQEFSLYISTAKLTTFFGIGLLG